MYCSSSFGVFNSPLISIIYVWYEFLFQSSDLCFDRYGSDADIEMRIKGMTMGIKDLHVNIDKNQLGILNLI